MANSPKLKGARALERLLARKSRDDVNVFHEFVFRTKQAECHVEMQAHMDREDRAGILAQKDLGKTTQALTRVLWLLGRDPNILIKIVCASDDLAVDRVMFLRDSITRNKRLRMVFPNLIRSPWFDDWGKKSLTVKRIKYLKDSSVEACGILTAATGGRANYILFDDVVDFQNAIKFPKLRGQVKEAFENIWIPMLGPDGKAAYLATPHHEDDLTNHLRKNTKWNWTDLSVKDDPPVSRWPERWTTEALEARRAEIGSIEFDRSMRCILHPDKERIIREAWISKFSTKADKPDVRTVSWDFAASGKDGDYTARAVVDIHIMERIMRVTAIDRWKGLTFNKMIDKMIRDFEEWEADRILVESSGFQVVMGRDERLDVLPVEHIVPKVNKEQRVRQTAPMYERGMILFKDGPTQLGIDEILSFPKGTFDDMTDCVTQGILWGIEMIGRPFSPEHYSAAGARSFSSGGGSSNGSGIGTTANMDEASGRYGKRIGFGAMKW